MHSLFTPLAILTDYLTFWHAIIIDLGALLVVVINGSRILSVQAFPRIQQSPQAPPSPARASLAPEPAMAPATLAAGPGAADNV